MFRNLPPVCRGLIVALVASALVSLVARSFVLGALPLYPPLVTHGFQVWRLVTYPFFFMAGDRPLFSSLISLAWIGMLIAFFGGELETIIHSRRFGSALAATVVAGGILFLIVGAEGTLAGPSIITMFVLAGFSYLWPKREISIFGFFWVKAWIISLAIFALSVIPMSGLNLDTSATNLFGPVFGVVGALIYFHSTYRQYKFGQNFLRRFDSVRGRTGRGMSTAEANDPRAVEQRIDFILEKISKSGMESLSKEEREFLLKHST